MFESRQGNGARFGRAPRRRLIALPCGLLAMLWLIALPALGNEPSDPERPHLHLLHDPDAGMGLAEARAAWAADRFTEHVSSSANYGFVEGAMWFAFSVEHPLAAQGPPLLVIEYTLLDHIELFRLDQQGSEPLWRGGDRQPFSARSLPLRYFNHALDLAAGERATFLLQVRSESSMQVPIVVSEPQSYLTGLQGSRLGLGAYFGVLAALLALNVFLFVSLRDRSYLYYVLYVSSVGLMLLCLSGIGYQLLWPDSPQLANLMVLLSMSLSLATMLQFTRAFLELRTRLPLGDRLCRWLLLLSLCGIPAALLFPYGPVVRALTLLVFPAGVLIYACGVLLWRRYPPARYFLVAWTSLLLATMIYASVSLGWLPRLAITEYVIQIGSAAEMVLLSYALAYRINLLTAQSARIESEAREQLERRVVERTADLDGALQRLEAANRQLEEFSRRDGLTGCLNRRSFDHLLRRSEESRIAGGQEFALLMIDIDEFKQVNDRLGHLAGDDCLRHVSRQLATLVEAAGGQLCRYGGEEFAAIISPCGAERALQLAEALRERVHAHPMARDGRLVTLSISVGLAVRGSPASAELLDVVRRADRALYRAKQEGRNRCIAADSG